MIALGIDPGSSYSGLALAKDGRVLEAVPVRMAKATVWMSALACVVPAVRALVRAHHEEVCGQGITVAVEHAPPGARKNTGRGAPTTQGEIGWTLGWAAAAIAACTIDALYLTEGEMAGVWLEKDEPLLVPVPDWRASMTAAAVQHRLLLRPPKGQTAEERRAWWKWAACRWFAAAYPDQWGPLTEGPRSRARTERFDHELAGVPDAAEAGAIAMHVTAKTTRTLRGRPGR